MRAIFWVFATVMLGVLGGAQAWAGANVNFSLTKTVDLVVVAPGGNLTYTLTVNNPSSSSASNVLVTDALPANTTFVSLVSPGGFTNVTPAVGGTGNTTSTIPNFAANSSAIFTIVVKVDDTVAAGTNIQNTATVTESGSNETDPSDNSDTVNTPVEICGDGKVGAGEECDDGNLIDGDCCNSSCQFEAQGSFCDDGDANTVDDNCDGNGLCTGQTPGSSPTPVPLLADVSGSGCSLSQGVTAGNWFYGVTSLGLVFGLLRKRK